MPADPPMRKEMGPGELYRTSAAISSSTGSRNGVSSATTNRSSDRFNTR